MEGFLKMEIAGKKILITGADGFIGSHVVERFLEMECKIKAFVFYNSFNSWGWLDTFSQEQLNQIEIFTGDIRDPHGVREAAKDCDIIIHLAALIAIPFSYHSPDSYVDTNIKGTLNILNASRDLGVKKLIVTSTSEVYGTAQYVPIDEEHPLQGQSPYSATKIGADQLALSFYKSFDVPVTIIRPFNTYGPRQSARAIIPTIITQIAAGKKEIHIGSIYPTRDLTFVKDTAEAFVKMTTCDGNLGEVINIGSGFEMSVGDLAKKIMTLMESDVEIISEDNRKRPEKSEVERLWANTQKAQDLLDWSPRYSLEEGLSNTIDWFREPANIQKYKADIYNL